MRTVDDILDRVGTVEPYEVEATVNGARNAAAMLPVSGHWPDVTIRLDEMLFFAECYAELRQRDADLPRCKVCGATDVDGPDYHNVGMCHACVLGE